jgi:hypothetical protein
VRENACRPYRTRALCASLPSTAVPGFHFPPLRGWSFVVLAPPLRSRVVLTKRLKPQSLIRGLTARLKSCRCQTHSLDDFYSH